ncbi:MAG: hypothetical protein PVH77_08845 [Phycisphaerales bacterium]
MVQYPPIGSGANVSRSSGRAHLAGRRKIAENRRFSYQQIHAGKDAHSHPTMNHS